MSVVRMAIRRVKKLFAWLLAGLLTVAIILLMAAGGVYVLEVVF